MLQQLIIRFGVCGVLIGAALEGDVTMILAGVVVHLGLLHLSPVIAMGTAGALISDCVFYALGRRGSKRIVQTKVYRRVGGVVERLAARLGAWEVVIARFVYGTRVGSMLFWGMQGLPLRRFVLLDLGGCVLWASALSGLGFLFSDAAGSLVGKVRRAELWLLAAFLISCAAAVTGRAVVRYRLHRQHPPAS